MRELPVSTGALLSFLKPQDVSGNNIIIMKNNNREQNTNSNDKDNPNYARPVKGKLKTIWDLIGWE